MPIPESSRSPNTKMLLSLNDLYVQFKTTPALYLKHIPENLQSSTESYVKTAEITLQPTKITLRSPEITLGPPEITFRPTGITLGFTEITLGSTGITLGPSKSLLSHLTSLICLLTSLLSYLTSLIYHLKSLLSHLTSKSGDFEELRLVAGRLEKKQKSQTFQPGLYGITVITLKQTSLSPLYSHSKPQSKPQNRPVLQPSHVSYHQRNSVLFCRS